MQVDIPSYIPRIFSILLNYMNYFLKKNVFIFIIFYSFPNSPKKL